MTGRLLVLVLGPLEASWYHRGPCGCGSDGCWVLVADGEDPPPEIHAPASAR
jgi:hypothetical protein